MKKLIAILILTLPALVRAAQPTILDQVQKMPDYKKIVRELKKVGGTFECSEPMEIIESQDYSQMPGVKSTYHLAILMCTRWPNDGGDAFPEAGLATISQGQVLSFTVGYIAKPD